MRSALLLIDHGSRRPEANAVLEEVAGFLRTAHPGLVVVAAHLEQAQPDIARGLALCVEARATEVVVVPYFLGPGRHAGEDVPRLVREAASAFAGLEVRITEPLGPDPLLAALVAKRAGLPSA